MGCTAYVIRYVEKIKPYKCVQCDYKASEDGSLRKHILDVHMKFRPYKCQECNYSASKKIQFKTACKK